MKINKDIDTSTAPKPIHQDGSRTLLSINPCLPAGRLSKPRALDREKSQEKSKG